ncbi:MAG: deoxyguanosinetriphosphate triphosphohydrolase [Burkholderiales bacterium]|nr:MAG: deoxyguanosinetriphosphate triphosphohydrolase [Burkholderiales bacterium]
MAERGWARTVTGLAAWAADPAASRGRRHHERGAATRNEFQRDRDRIVHCTAFRRLEYKTQVFVNHEGDLFRTRLTHSIEVAQIARSIGRSLRLAEDLVEAIALAHDLGHTPFGHAGQDALHDCMRAHGGFEHNLQSLRVVDELEQRYGAFDGLNLCFETREGILKHCSAENARALGELGDRFLQRRQPSLEAQVANLADEIAYNNHDVDDGLRSGLIRLAQLDDIELFAGHRRAVEQLYPGIAGRRLVHETIRRMIDDLVVDLLEETRRRIEASAVRTLDDVRAAPALVAFSAAMRERSAQLKRFLHAGLYRHPHVDEVMDRARRVVRQLFDAYAADPSRLPDEHRDRVEAIGLRAVADYIAGMTDRFALREHARLTGEAAPDAVRFDAAPWLGAADN